ncbi:MAG: DEAD/DEAH box helicase [Dehalococcoidia bacterium]|nr:DEAD/DEAH box helicase [Dehalococcoidia bacterium]
MSPLSGFLKRLVGENTQSKTQTKQRNSKNNRKQTQKGKNNKQNNSKPQQTAIRNKVKNTKRPTRRNSSSTESNRPQSEHKQNASPKDRKESYAWGSVADNDGKKELLNERRRQSQRRWGQFNPRRKTLEVPLPEDVAFRSVEDGGAGNILPSKRNRPIGLKSTERVIVGGARSLGGLPVTGDYHTTLQQNESAKHIETNRKTRTQTKREPLSENTKEPDPTSPIEINEETELISTHSFEDLGLDEKSLKSLKNLGFKNPTPIQEKSIPELISGHDTVGLAQTGSGKTLAFSLPMMQSIDPEINAVQAIVLVPTRELAQQVLEVVTSLGDSRKIRAVGLLGGHSVKDDLRNLDQPTQIIVGTPGRIIDHLQRNTLTLKKVKYAVLDEADQMLDIGFLPDIRKILGRTPKSRQTILFSATMPTQIRRLVWQFMSDAVTIKVDSELSTVESITQVYFEVAERDKINGLLELIESELRGRTLVFCNMRRGVDDVADQLNQNSIKVGALHGDMDQKKRDQVVNRFRKGNLDILIATNVAARGIDIPEITHVVNFDLPQNAEEYVHRIGRTGRAGRNGKAITFVSEWDFERFMQISEQFEQTITQEHLTFY